MVHIYHHSIFHNLLNSGHCLVANLRVLPVFRCQQTVGRNTCGATNVIVEGAKCRLVGWVETVVVGCIGAELNTKRGTLLVERLDKSLILFDCLVRGKEWAHRPHVSSWCELHEGEIGVGFRSVVNGNVVEKELKCLPELFDCNGLGRHDGPGRLSDRDLAVDLDYSRCDHAEGTASTA